MAEHISAVEEPSMVGTPATSQQHQVSLKAQKVNIVQYRADT